MLANSLDAEKVESLLTVCGFPNLIHYIINPTALIHGRTLELSSRRPDLIAQIFSI